MSNCSTNLCYWNEKQDSRIKAPITGIGLSTELAVTWVTIIVFWFCRKLCFINGLSRQSISVNIFTFSQNICCWTCVPPLAFIWSSWYSKSKFQIAFLYFIPLFWVLLIALLHQLYFLFCCKWKGEEGKKWVLFPRSASVELKNRSVWDDFWFHFFWTTLHFLKYSLTTIPLFIFWHRLGSFY